LQASSLLSDIAKRVATFEKENPDKQVIRMGIGDVTRELPDACIKAFHAGVEDMAQEKTFRGYGPEQGYDFLREIIAKNDFQSRGAQIEADEILKFISLNSKSKVLAGRLGVIDRKRLELGKALSTKPKILLLDEIMAGLNPAEVLAATDLVKQIRDSGISLIVIEHMMKAIMGICHRVIVLNAGKKITEGKPQEVVLNRDVIEAFLGEDQDAED